MKKEKQWTLKVIKGKAYLYTWEFNEEKTRIKREEMMKTMRENPECGITPRDLGTKASRYDWKSHGQWNLDKPSEKLRNYLAENPQNILDIQKEVEQKVMQQVK